MAAHISQLVGVALVVFGITAWAGRGNASAAPPGTRRESLDVRFKAVPAWVFTAVIAVGVVLVVVGVIES